MRSPVASVRSAVAFVAVFEFWHTRGEEPARGTVEDECTSGDGDDGVCRRMSEGAEVDVTVPGILTTVARAAGCGDDNLKSVAPRVGPFPGESIDSEVFFSRRAMEMLDCLFGKWYQSDGYGNRYAAEMGQEGTYGEITPQGVAALFSLVGKLGGPMSHEDAFFDLGSGVGKMVLQAYLTTGAGSSIGIELDASRHNDADAALQGLLRQHDKLPFGRHINFAHDDIRNTERWSNATVVYAASLCFPMWLMVEFSWLVASSLRPGAVLFSLKALPGCHPGLRLIGTVSADMSWAQLSEVHVYVVPPIDFRPPTWFSVTETQWQEFVQTEADKISLADEKAIPVEIYGKRCAQHWSGIAELIASRGIASATIEFDDKGFNKNTLGGLVPPAEATARQVAAASMHLVWGDGNSMVRCVCRELEAVIMAEGDTGNTTQLRSWFLGNLSDVNLADSAGQTLLHVVGQTRHRKVAPNVIRALVAGGAELHARDKLGRTPLHIVADRGHMEIARTLLEERADPNREDDSQASPVAYAAKWGYISVLELLFEFGGDAGQHGSPLRFAIERQVDQVVPVLLDNGAEVNALDTSGRTPLGIAAQKGSGPIVELLLERGARVDAADEKTGFAPLHHAVEREQLAVVSLLLERRAPVHTPTLAGKPPLHLLKARKKKSAPGSRVSLARELLKYRADPDGRDSGEERSTLLQFVTTQGDTDLMDDLFIARADPNQRDASGTSLVYLSAVAGHVPVLTRLLDARAAPDEQAGRGSTPVREAAAAGHVEMLSLLLERRAGVESPSGSSSPPLLHFAAKNGHAKACEALLARGAEVDVRDAMDDSALHGAVKGGHVESTQVLLERRAPVDATGAGSQTALHRSAIHGHVDVARLLLGQSASRTARDASGWVPFEHVRRGGAGRAVGHSPDTLSELERMLQ